MDTKTTFAMMEKALPVVLELIQDEEVVDFKETIKDEENAKNTTMGEAMQKLMPVFLMKKRDCVIRLLAVVTGKTVEQVEEQDYTITKVDMKSMLIGDIFDFFAWSLRMATKA